MIRMHNFPWELPMASSVLAMGMGFIAFMLFWPVTRPEGGEASAPYSKSAYFVPKAQLAVELGVKTRLPAVPPAIRRSESKLVKYELTVTETESQIAPALIYKSLWTFDGTVPGPVMRLRVGDVARITLRNDSASIMPHNIDFHFVSGPGGGAVNTVVPPGGVKIIEVRALYPGFYMYHCAFGNVVQHIANGMYGYLIVDPETPLPEMPEFAVVQSEFYGADDHLTDASKHMERAMQLLADERPDYVLYNGRHLSLKVTPEITANAGETIRLYYGNAGLNMASNFHVIGTIFDRVYQNANLVSPPAEWGVQTVSVPAGGATIAEFKVWSGGHLIVDHALSRVFMKGLGEKIAVTGDPDPEVYQAMP